MHICYTHTLILYAGVKSFFGGTTFSPVEAAGWLMVMFRVHLFTQSVHHQITFVSICVSAASHKSHESGL